MCTQQEIGSLQSWSHTLGRSLKSRCTAFGTHCRTHRRRRHRTWARHTSRCHSCMWRPNKRCRQPGLLIGCSSARMGSLSSSKMSGRSIVQTQTTRANRSSTLWLAAARGASTSGPSQCEGFWGRCQAAPPLPVCPSTALPYCRRWPSWRGKLAAHAAASATAHMAAACGMHATPTACMAHAVILWHST